MSKGLLKGFTLVELLVVITIIGILASLITVAAVGTLRKARQTEIKVEIDQIDSAFKNYKNKSTAFPPNCQTDGLPQSERPLDEAAVLRELKRHMKQAFPLHQESEDLLRVLVNYPDPMNSSDYPKDLPGGLSAGEAIVFWLGGFSSDPRYPISGEGGPSYRIEQFDQAENRTLDPIESRQWSFPFDVARLGPRTGDGYYDERRRFIEYRDPKGTMRRINFWQYLPRKSARPYLYFDTSRNPAAVHDYDGNVVGRFDPPAATFQTGDMSLFVYAFKKASNSAGQSVPIEFVDPRGFQVIHCGVDEEWDTDAFAMMSARGLIERGHNPNNIDDYLVFPDGPFIGQIADTIVNFAPVTRIEDAAE